MSSVLQASPWFPHLTLHLKSFALLQHLCPIAHHCLLRWWYEGVKSFRRYLFVCTSTTDCNSATTTLFDDFLCFSFGSNDFSDVVGFRIVYSLLCEIDFLEFLQRFIVFRWNETKDKNKITYWASFSYNPQWARFFHDEADLSSWLLSYWVFSHPCHRWAREMVTWYQYLRVHSC